MPPARRSAVGSLALATVTLTSAAGAGSPPVVSSGAVQWRGATAIVDLDPADLARAARQSTQVLIEQVPLARDHAVDLLVERFSITGPKTRFVVGPDHRPRAGFDPAAITLLRGRVKGEAGSHVYLAVSEHDTTGFIELPSAGRRYNISSRPGAGIETGPGRLAVFRDAGGIGPLLGVPVCGVDGPARPPAPHPVGAVSSPTMTRIQLAVETDYEYYALFGDADAAAAYVVQLYGAVSSIYMRDLDARLDLAFVGIWDTPTDPYDADDPLGPFQSFWETNMGGVERDAAQLLTGRRNLPYGGAAYVEALCTDFAYSVAGYVTGSFASLETPSFANFDLIVTAHELGHNCGTYHTHDYGIDSCAFGAVQRGTIMSYCHTTPGGNANIDLYFHSFIQSVVEGFVAGVVCVEDDCNGNGVDDASDILGGAADDDGDGIPDECQDCNGNGTLDSIDIAGASTDLNGNGIPDECEADCNGNLVPDNLDIAQGDSVDLYGDGVPDECEADCDGSGTSDYTEIQADMSLDLNRNAILDSCEDCDDDGTTDFATLAGANNLWVLSKVYGVANQMHAGTGVLVSTSDAGHAGSPQDLVIRPDGHLLVSSALDDRIVEYDADGSYVRDLVPSGFGGLDFPSGLALSPVGTLLVASATHNVLEYNATFGTYLGQFVTAGDGGLVNPKALAFGPNGNLFVSSFDNRVLEYDGGSGAFVGVFVSFVSGGLIDPQGLVFKPDGTLLVSSDDTDEILEYDGQTGAFVGRWDHGGLASGFWGLDHPGDLEIGPNGNVYVSSVGNAAVHMYDIETGAFMRTYYVLAAAGPLQAPGGIAFVDGSGIDCNVNLVPDGCDIAAGTSPDNNGNGIPDECEAIPGDLDGDGLVGITDFLLLLAAWGPCPEPCPPSCAADLDGDCTVGITDFLALLANWS